ncbi:MAG: DUF6316 family protein [Gammaproteobacteria bacterium]
MNGTVRSTRRQTLNRYYHKDGKWYVETREGIQGPFVRREEAVAHLDKHKRKHVSKRG